jgi:hypothetical protein
MRTEFLVGTVLASDMVWLVRESRTKNCPTAGCVTPREMAIELSCGRLPQKQMLSVVENVVRVKPNLGKLRTLGEQKKNGLPGFASIGCF